MKDKFAKITIRIDFTTEINGVNAIEYKDLTKDTDLFNEIASSIVNSINESKKDTIDDICNMADGRVDHLRWLSPSYNKEGEWIKIYYPYQCSTKGAIVINEPIQYGSTRYKEDRSRNK